MMKGKIERLIALPIKKILKFFILVWSNIADSLFMRNNKLVPPSRLRVLVGPFVNAFYYQAVGKEYLRYLKYFCALKPDEAILDVGCGCGQMAAQLVNYLDVNGKYEGFDIISALIDWCKENITTKYSNFNFQLADVYNKTYNPEGKYKTSEYRFPYKNETFDLIFLKSVFTHMLPEDIENYLLEISRVLKKDARCLITYFILNKESMEKINAKSSTLSFKYAFKNYRIIDEDMPEKAVAHDEEFIRNLYGKAGLKIIEPIRFGSWASCVRKNYLAYQDIILAVK